MLDRIKEEKVARKKKNVKELESEKEKNAKILKFTRTSLHFLKCLAQ